MKMSKDLSHIILDHGTGALLSQDLINSIITPRLGKVHKGDMNDSAVLNLTANKIAMTTDSFSIDPIFFGNGNIGKVSVCGTVNDLAVSGATPLYLTFAMILEAGFPISDLERILDSVRQAAEEANVYIVAGDTKVVDKGEADKIFINTSGIGIFQNGAKPTETKNIQPGDDIIVTGLLGNHSIHILSIREGLGFEQRILSDCAPLNGMVASVLKSNSSHVHFMRDITRGGLSSVLNEIAEASDLGIEVKLDQLPIQYEVEMAADMLGINPIHLANEGNICMIVSPDATENVLKYLQQHQYGKHASVIGKVTDRKRHKVISISDDGQMGIMEPLYAQELPRLC